MNITTIENALFDWADAQTTLDVVWVDENAPRPDDPYFSLRMMNSARIGQDFVDVPDGTTELATITGNRDIIIEVQSYGAGAWSAIEGMRTSLSKPSVQAALRANGLVYVDSTPITNLTLPIESRMEERRVFEATFRTAEQVTDDLGVIETVNVGATVKDTDGSTAYSGTITVPEP